MKKLTWKSFFERSIPLTKGNTPGPSSAIVHVTFLDLDFRLMRTKLNGKIDPIHSSLTTHKVIQTKKKLSVLSFAFVSCRFSLVK